MGVDGTLGEYVAGLQYLSVQHLDPGSIGDQVGLGVSGLCIRNDDLALLLCILNGDHTAELSDDGKSLGPSCLKQLLDTGKTLCDIAAGNAACMEGTHGQLGTRLTDGLGRDDPDCLAHLYRLAGGHVGTVTLRADTDVTLTGQYSTDLNGLSS